MLAKPFNRSVAESLLSPTGTNKYWEIDDQGLWPKAEWSPAMGTGNRIDFEFDSWRPAVMLANDPLPQEPGNLPALPFPFDAKDLAAFMLYGFGALVADHYGDWENGPNLERIGDLYPLDFSRRAVREAFEAYREAQKIVGPYPLELDAKADRARKAWNEATREKDKATIAELDLEMEATAAEAQAAKGTWLEAMVRELLKTAPVIGECGFSIDELGDKDYSEASKKQMNGTTKRWTNAAVHDEAAAMRKIWQKSIQEDALLAEDADDEARTLAQKINTDRAGARAAEDKRRQDGWLYPWEASFLMANAAGEDKSQAQVFEEMLIDAASKGSLQVRDPVTRLVTNADSRDRLILLADLNNWLEAQSVGYQVATPAPDAAAPAPVLVASDTSANRKNRKPSWVVEAMPYMKKLYANGKYRSCSVFFKALKNGVSSEDSPFTLVKGELYCDKAGTTVAESTLGNVWKDVRTQ